MIKWPIRKRIWRWFHGRANRLAWRFARPPGPEWGLALRINKKHPLWRLNDFFAGHYVGWFIEQTRSKHNDK